MDGVAGYARGNQLPDTFVSVINKEFGDELDATDGDSCRDFACYEPSDESRSGGS